MPNYPKIWFLRHGQTEWNKQYRLQGQLDSPLTEQGIAEAKRQAVLIDSVLSEAPPILVSPLGRARQTADIALAGKAYRVDNRLMEINAGAWQGLLRAEIFAQNTSLSAKNLTPLETYDTAPNGEGLAALHARIVSFLDELVEPTIVVAHGLFGQVMRAHTQGINIGQAGQLSNDQGCIYVLEDGVETVLESPPST